MNGKTPKPADTCSHGQPDILGPIDRRDKRAANWQPDLMGVSYGN
jgi:hypothetical protein